LNLVTHKKDIMNSTYINIRKCDKRSERYFISEEGGKEESSFAWKVPRFRSLVFLISQPLA
jgi:hypothetical protein